MARFNQKVPNPMSGIEKGKKPHKQKQPSNLSAGPAPTPIAPVDPKGPVQSGRAKPVAEY